MHPSEATLDLKKLDNPIYLPPEILDLIVHCIDDRATLKSVSLASRLFGALTRAPLLRRLCLDSAPSCSDFLASCVDTDHASLVTELRLQPTNRDSVILPPGSLVPVIPLLRNVRHLELAGGWALDYQSEQESEGTDDIAAVDVLFGTSTEPGLVNVRSFVAQSVTTNGRAGGLCAMLRRMPHLDDLTLFNVTGEVSSSVKEGRVKDAVKLRSLRFGEEWEIQYMMEGAKLHWSPFCLEYLRELHLDAPPVTDEKVVKDLFEYLSGHLEVLTLTGPLRESILPPNWDEKDHDAASATQRFKYRGLNLRSLTLRVGKSKSIVQWLTRYIHRVRSPWSIADLRILVSVTGADEWDTDETWGEFDDALGALDGGPPKAIGVYMRAGGALNLPQSEQGEEGIQDVEQKRRIALTQAQETIYQGMKSARMEGRIHFHR